MDKYFSWSYAIPRTFIVYFKSDCSLSWAAKLLVKINCLTRQHSLINYIIIRLGTWWKMKETWCLVHWAVQAQILLVRSKRWVHKYSLKYLWYFHCILFCWKITFISSKNLFFLFLDMKGVEAGQAVLSVIIQIQLLLRQTRSHFCLCQQCDTVRTGASWLFEKVLSGHYWPSENLMKNEASGDTSLLQYFAFERGSTFFICQETCSDKSDPPSPHILDQTALYESLVAFYGY